MSELKRIFLEFHEKYNLIFDEQSKLPQRKGKKDYSEIESEIIVMSRKLIQEIDIFKINNEKYKDNFDELDNIADGCYKLIQNPYKKLGGRINLD